MNKYRKIWESINGPIPKDENGRSYDIHHIDGNHNNNDISNLKLVTVEEHYNIHYTQGDFGACFLLAKRLLMSPDEFSEIARKSNMKRIAEGTHPFLDKEKQREWAIERVNNGTHHFLNSDLQSKNQLIRIKNGTHHFLKGGPREDLKGENNPMKRPEVVKKVSDNSKGKPRNWTDKRTQADFNRRGSKLQLSEEGLQKKKEQGRKQFTLNNPTNIKMTCIHCNKTMDKPNHNRWHGDNCKEKPV